MSFMELAKARFSARSFSDKVVEKEKLDMILEAGHIAPTAKNIQPQRIYVIKREEGLKKINELCPCIFGATTVFLFTYNVDEEWKNLFDDKIHSGVEDVSIVATHMMLEAKDLGIDSCWVNRFNNHEVEKAFNIPTNEKSVLLLPIGYANADCVPSSRHGETRNIDELVKYL